MSVRSTVLDLFGEYVQHAGGAIGLSPLSDLLGVAGIQPDATRALMTRLRSEGWFTSRREGRKVSYSITPYLHAVLDEGRGRIYRTADGDWDGSWHMVIYHIPENRRALREALRKRLTFLGFGSPAPSTWLSARDLRARVELLLLDLGVEDVSEVGLIQMLSGTGSVAVDRQIARRCWQLDAINDAYLEWIRTWRPKIQAYAADPPRGGAALAADVALVGTYRKFPFIDPALPADLLPARWHGRTAYSLFMAGHLALQPAADAWFEKTTGMPVDRSSASLPATEITAGLPR
ncbi:PaaX family transcriptional regulator C-terminal domain-containing protein [Georgenia yuyongxinii]|uniref:PaaX family transcriptional regulator n=1 Tax=Georgenia yuyongxinii TaxID=2589797 RepID=A0A552WUA5_9MICO|nr:PaaX family transcriptional regulator C-terminal domain-containing protein [Georgenia yuyongxinii]TRW46265.1 hypothetical protein FJ693_05850 [Georgenia yuyongxinii]